jgi:hypothetical protein
MFDMYYLCLLAGLAKTRLASLKDSDTAELVDYFPSEYAPRGKVVIALFLSRELARQSIGLGERKLLNEAIAALVDADSPSKLSTAGMKLVNEYAAGGLDVLKEWFDDPPQRLQTFLPALHKRIRDAVGEPSELGGREKRSSRRPPASSSSQDSSRDAVE